MKSAVNDVSSRSYSSLNAASTGSMHSRRIAVTLKRTQKHVWNVGERGYEHMPLMLVKAKVAKDKSCTRSK
jgi:hypothetical protein